MPMNIANAESAWLSGRTKRDDWEMKFTAAWSAPVLQTSNRLLAQQLSQLPEPVRMQMQQRHPKAWGEVEKLISGGK